MFKVNCSLQFYVCQCPEMLFHRCENRKKKKGREAQGMMIPVVVASKSPFPSILMLYKYFQPYKVTAINQQ